MTKYLTILLIVFLSSCCGTHTEIKYKYADITIKRIDECGKTTFYYQKGQEQISGRIWAEYSGINDGFKGYLEFNENGRVSLLSGDGYFQTSTDLDTTRFNYKRIYAYSRPELSENVCQIMLSPKYEKERNLEFESGIQVEYNIDKNEWW
jgi:hypothetical protein